MEILTRSETFTSPLYLESGRILEPWSLTYESYGELNESRDNTIIITHALSGSHHAAGWYENDRKPGWWDKLIGDGKAIDTTRYHVLCINVIGSCFGSTGPMSPMYPSSEPYRFKFPVVMVNDMVKAQRILLDRLKIDHVKAIIGGSMGGMQALSFAVKFPTFADIVIPMAATHATRPHVTAAIRAMMEAVRNDPVFDHGNYHAEDRESINGLAVARMIGFLGYLSPQAMDRKFGRAYVQTDGLFELFGRFEVERYLEYNGYNFPRWFDPLSYLYILKAISIFDLAFGFESLEEALKEVRSRLHLIGFKGDGLFYPEEMQMIKNVMDFIGKGELCTYHEVPSDYGHDSFLVETDRFEDYLAYLLKE